MIYLYECVSILVNNYTAEVHKSHKTPSLLQITKIKGIKKTSCEFA